MSSSRTPHESSTSHRDLSYSPYDHDHYDYYTNSNVSRKRSRDEHHRDEHHRDEPSRRDEHRRDEPSRRSDPSRRDEHRQDEPLIVNSAVPDRIRKYSHNSIMTPWKNAPCSSTNCNKKLCPYFHQNEPKLNGILLVQQSGSIGKPCVLDLNNRLVAERLIDALSTVYNYQIDLEYD